MTGAGLQNPGRSSLASCGLAVRLFHELANCKFSGPINTHEEVELSLRRMNLGDAYMEET